VLGQRSTVLHWHGETFSLPEGAVLLAESPVCKNQAFSWGTHALGLQFHLEASGAALERWFIGHIGELMQAGLDVNALRADTARHSAAIQERARSFFARWLSERSL
jgi:GMP synthase (glutamine-hydrolysing)